MSDMEQNPEPVLDTKPKPFVFVLMPFDKAFTDIYQLGIKPACEKAGAYAQRLDEQLFGESMLQRIYNQIAKADVIVADMTGRNPNVFYEVGYAHALGEVVILLTQKDEDIPFDLKHYQHIVYENVTCLLPELEKVVRWAVQQSSEKRRPPSPVAVYLEGEQLAERTISTFIMGNADQRAMTFTLVYANTDELRPVVFNVALWTSNKFSTCEWIEPGTEPVPEFWMPALTPKPPPENKVWAVHHPDRKHVFNRHKPITLLPGQWRQDTLDLAFREHAKMGEREDMEVHISAEGGSHNFPIIFKTSK